MSSRAASQSKPLSKNNFGDNFKFLIQCNDRQRTKVFEEYFIYKNSMDSGRDPFLNRKDDYKDKVT